MNAIRLLAVNEFVDGLRNRWVAACILLLGSMALTLLLVGSAPTGTIGAGALAARFFALLGFLVGSRTSSGPNSPSTCPDAPTALLLL